MLLWRSGQDLIDGGGGDDRAYAGAGDDSLFGRSGSDLFYGESGKDTLRGHSGADSLPGESGVDTLLGAEGDDTAEGSDGNDRLGGGLRWRFSLRRKRQRSLERRFRCRYRSRWAGQRHLRRDTAAGGAENVLRSDAAAYTLASGAEGFLERANINRTAGGPSLFGNEKANILVGGSGGNLLVGGSGNRILNGGLCTDSMIGAFGDDTFVVKVASDSLSELSGQGSDLVRAEVDFTLPDGTATAFLDNLRMQGGKGDIDGSGNSLDNTVEGKAIPATIAWRGPAAVTLCGWRAATSSSAAATRTIYSSMVGIWVRPAVVGR